LSCADVPSRTEQTRTPNLEIATPDEARAKLGTKGGNNVNF